MRSQKKRRDSFLLIVFLEFRKISFTITAYGVRIYVICTYVCTYYETGALCIRRYYVCLAQKWGPSCVPRRTLFVCVQLSNDDDDKRRIAAASPNGKNLGVCVCAYVVFHNSRSYWKRKCDHVQPKIGCVCVQNWRKGDLGISRRY